MRKALSFILLLLLVIGCAGKNEKRDYFFNKGLTHFKQGNYLKADQNFKNAILIDKEFALAYYKRGECRIGIGKWKQATPYLRLAVRHNSQLIEAQLCLVELLILDGKLNEAKKTIDAVLDRYPSNSRAQLISGIMDIKANLAHEAEKRLTQLITNQAPNAFKSHQVLASLLCNESDKAAETELLKQLKKLDKNIPPSLLVLVGLCLIEKNHLDSETALEKLKAVYHGRENAIALLASIATDLSQLELAEKIYKMLIEDQPDITNYRIKLATYYNKQHRADDALAILEEGLEHKPDNLELQKMKSELTPKDPQKNSSPKNSLYITQNGEIHNKYMADWIKIAIIVVGSFMFVLILFNRNRTEDSAT